MLPQDDPRPIDAHIRPLVDALNALPGVTTYASCSAHPDDHSGAARKRQLRGGQMWYVALGCDHSDPRSLAAIVRTAGTSSLSKDEKPLREPYDAYLEVLPHWHAPDYDAVVYVLRGTGQLPAVVARLAQGAAGALTIDAVTDGRTRRGT